MNKNVVIFILVLFTLLGSIWGSVANRQKISIEQDLKNLQAEMEKLTSQTSKEREQVLGKTAGLQDTLAEKENQLQKARNELVTLRKSIKAVESQLSECTATLQKMNLKNENYRKELQTAKNTNSSLKAALARQAEEKKTMALQAGEPEAEAAGTAAAETETVQGEGVPVEEKDQQEIFALQDQLQTTSLTVDQLREELNACNAQIIGMEKLVDEKNAALDETTQEMDRLKINMDVLLSKIADQRDFLQELQEKNRELEKELTDKNEEIADLHEEIMKSPVKQE
jgi:putative ABC transport system permease protein